MKKTRMDWVLRIVAVWGMVGITTTAFPIPVRAQPHHESKPPSSAVSGPKQTIVMHLNNGTDDLHAAFMALKLGTALQQRGAEVILVLTIEGVRLADRNQPLDLRWGRGNMTLAQLYDQFVAAGGEVRVCPVCADAAGVKAEDLRPGAQMATGDRDIPNLLLSADKVVDF